MAEIVVDVWLYGAMARYGGSEAGPGYARRSLALPAGSTMADLLAQLSAPTEERGLTFINGQLSAMPGLQPDLTHTLADGDRVGMFDPRSMFPFQYRHGAALTDELARAFEERDHGLHHSFER